MVMITSSTTMEYLKFLRLGNLIHYLLHLYHTFLLSGDSKDLRLYLSPVVYSYANKLR